MGGSASRRPIEIFAAIFVAAGFIYSFHLGTDALGRDVFAGMIYGARVSLLVGLVSTLAALAIGVPLGAIAGYFGGRIDDALMRFTEFFQTIPSFALAIVLVAILQPSIYSIVASIDACRPWRVPRCPCRVSRSKRSASASHISRGE